MKKFLKILFIIILLFIFLEIAAWIIAIHFAKSRFPLYMNNAQLVSPIKWRPIKEFKEYYSDLKFRPASGLNYKNRPIVIFGCSFAYGDGLDNNQTFPYKLSNEMKSPVYSRAFSGSGVQHMLWQLRNEPVIDSIKDPKFVIYVFINDHISRLKRYSEIFLFMIYKKHYIPEYLRYKEQNGHLVPEHDRFPLLRHTMLANLIMLSYDSGIWDRIKNDKTRKKTLDFMELHFLESQKIINKKWPNAKIIILDYEEGWDGNNSPDIYSDFWQKMQTKGFIYINARKEFNVGSSELKYRISDIDPHPNELAWDTIVPMLTKKLEEISSKK